MSALQVIRRLHLYLGMFLVPWMLAFGVSSLPLNHTTWNRPVTWTVIEERAYQLDMPQEAGLRALGARLLNDAGLAGGFYVSRPNAGRIVDTTTKAREIQFGLKFTF